MDRVMIVMMSLILLISGCRSVDRGEVAYRVGKYSAMVYVVKSDGIDEKMRGDIELIYKIMRGIVKGGGVNDIKGLRELVREGIRKRVKDGRRVKILEKLTMSLIDDLVYELRGRLEGTEINSVLERYLEGIEFIIKE